MDISELMALPDPLVTRNRHKVPTLEGLGLLHAQLQSQEDLLSLSMKYKWSQSEILEINNEVMQTIDKMWSHHLEWDQNGNLSPTSL